MNPDSVRLPSSLPKLPFVIENVFEIPSKHAPYGTFATELRVQRAGIVASMHWIRTGERFTQFSTIRRGSGVRSVHDVRCNGENRKRVLGVFECGCLAKFFDKRIHDPFCEFIHVIRVIAVLWKFTFDVERCK